MDDFFKLPHRRMLIAGCAAAGVAAFARPAASAEAKVPAVQWAPTPRPWADFEAAKAMAEREVSTPAGVDGVMMRQLGPLPWAFTGSPYGTAVVTRLAPMADPEEHDEATGVWAIVRYTDPAGRSAAVLVQVGRLALTLKKRAQIATHAWMLADFEGAKVCVYQGVTMHYTLVDDAPLILNIKLDAIRYQGAMESLMKAIEAELSTGISPPFVLMPPVT